MFGAVGDGKTDDYEALAAAFSYCRRFKVALTLAGGTYLIRHGGRPALRAETDVTGAGTIATTLLCDSGSSGGTAMELGSYARLAALTLIASTRDPATTGVAIRATKSDEFSGHVVMDRVRVEGFGVNVRVVNCYQWSMRDCIIQAGGEGIYYDSSGYKPGTDSGYFNNGSIEGCMLNGNGRNLYVSTPRKSANLFIGRGTAIQQAYGSSEQAFIKGVRPLIMETCYGEGKPRIAWLRVAECDMSIDGCFLTGTGGIDLGTAWGSATLRRIYGAEANDAIRASGGVGQTLSCEDCELGGDPATLTPRRLSLTRCRVGKVEYPDVSLGVPMTIAPAGRTARALALLDLAQVTARPVQLAANQSETVARLPLDRGLAAVAFVMPTRAVPGILFSAVGDGNGIAVIATNSTAHTVPVPASLPLAVSVLGFQ